MDRKEYWNEEYTRYWKEAAKEAEETGVSVSNVKKEHEGDFKTPGEKIIEDVFSLLHYAKSDKLLDYGCGFGRFFPYFNSRADYFGIDISESMIIECKKHWPDDGQRFSIAEGENLPFENSSFDKIVCYGVFDCCYQEQALFEMLRVLKVSGWMLVTGKYTDYHNDDEQAFIAEEAARKKNHPNYFTDIKKLKNILGTDVVYQRFYLYRGDFAKGIYVEKQMEKFYEWCLIIKKSHEYRQKFEKFSDMFSNTWKEKCKGGVSYKYVGCLCSTLCRYRRTAA